MTAALVGRVLLVEYDRAVLKEIIAHMQDWGGWDILVAHSPEEALRISYEQHIDVVITDMDMPGVPWDKWQDEIDKAPFTIPNIMICSSPSVEIGRAHV